MKILAALVVVALIFTAFVVLDGARFLELQTLGEALQSWRLTLGENIAVAMVITTLVYMVLMSTPLPVAAVSILSSGYLFGLVPGLLVILSAVLVASTVTFLLSRYVGAEFFRARFGPKLALINSEFENAGFWYSLSLRLSSVVPFFVLNAGLGLTSLKLRDFVSSTFLGMIPVCIVLVNAGTQLANIERMEDVLNAKLLISFILVAILPLAVRWALAKFNQPS